MFALIRAIRGFPFSRVVWLVLSGLALAGPAHADPVVGELRVQGNDRATPGFLRRASGLEPGDPASADSLAEARRLLMNTRLFQDVQVSTPAGAPAAGAVPVDIAVRERWTLGVYPDFSQNGDRTTFGLGVEETNLFGEGLRLGGRGWGGSDGDGGEVWFADPWAFGPDVFYEVAGGGGRWFDRYYDTDGNLLAENEIDYTTAGFTGGVRLDSRWRAWGGAATRDEDLDRKKGAVLTETGRFDILRAGVVYDATAYEITRVEGWRAWAQADRGTHAFGGDFAYRKTGIGAAWFRRPWEGRDHLLILDGSAWHGSTLPFREFFALGGAGSVRGYRVGEFRGRRLVRGAAEFQDPFWHPELAGYHAEVSWAAFVDAGVAWTDTDDLSTGDIAPGIGVGLRVAVRELSFAGGRLDVAYGFETDDVQAYFSFGPVF